jgi:hypothetical protein
MTQAHSNPPRRRHRRARRCSGNQSQIEDLIFADKQLEYFLYDEDLLFPAKMCYFKFADIWRKSWFRV